jgi:hypothetical protein
MVGFAKMRGLGSLKVAENGKFWHMILKYANIE